jgi:hypothetical protein
MTAPFWYVGPHAGVNNRRKATGSARAKPRAIEHKLQVALLDYLAIAARPEIYYFAIPNQSNRHIANAARMKAEGVRAGSPDLCILLPAGRVAWLEMKAPKGTLSDAQKAFRDRAKSLDHYWAMARSVEEALLHLTAWGALKPAYSTALSPTTQFTQAAT